jgi:MSHA biogenesis protein MshM
VVAGFQGGRLFDSMATWLLERKTRRIPRLVNIVAHKSLLSAYGKGKRRVGFFDVLAASNDTASLENQQPPRTWGLVLLLVLGSCLATLGWVSL